jgi:hypothetical protein
MNLKKELRQSGYDFIDSPIRNHKPLQLWLKKPFNSAELYYENISHAFVSDVILNTYHDEALTVDYGQKQEYKFNIGITVLEDLLTSLGLGNLGVGVKFKGGKKVSISYNNSKTISIASGEISNYLSTADFKHPNRELMRNANKDNIIVISGILTAKDLKATIETNSDITAELEAELLKVADGKLDFYIISEKKLEMISEGNSSFPIAVKANRIDFDKGEFSKMTIVTDNRYFF